MEDFLENLNDRRCSTGLEEQKTTGGGSRAHLLGSSAPSSLFLGAPFGLFLPCQAQSMALYLDTLPLSGGCHTVLRKP